MLGFTGKLCEININDCTAGVCGNNGTCIDLVNSYNCQCDPTYIGKYCETSKLLFTYYLVYVYFKVFYLFVVYYVEI